MAPTFDVFLSHNSKDKPLVRQIKARLQGYGLRPWLDADELRPGLPFQEGLEAAMKTTRAAAVFVGPHGFGNWQKPEIRACLNQLFTEGKPVIPVLLPGAPDKPDLGLFLRENTWVDLRAGLTDEGIERLVWGITGKKPERRKRRTPTARAATVEGAPERSRHFQDRSAEVAACRTALRTSRLVTLLGLPGAGKSEVSLAVAEAVLQDRALRPARALWLSLAGLRHVDEITGRLALAFAAGDVQKPETLAAVIGDQGVLLVFDNAEDLIVPARSSFQAFCGTLLRLCRGLRLLLTSRRRLGNVNGCDEIEVQVGRLPPPLDLHLFRSAAAGRLSPQELASPELPALVAALDGHPLSLVLVAGQAGRGLSLATLRRQLDREGDAAILADELLGDPDVASTPDEELRTKRLISSLNLSVSPLVEKHPATAEVFFWLGHFPAGLLTELVPALFGEEGSTHQRLLLGHNLVELVRNPDTRLVLPAPVRWYARRRLANLPIDRQKDLLTATLGGLGKALQAASDRSTGEHAPASLGLALREEPNLAALLAEAARHASSGGEALAEATSRALVPWLYLMSRAGRPAAALGLGEPAAQAIVSFAPGTAAEANTLRRLGDLYVRTDRLREAEDAYQKALPIYQQIEARLGEANTRQALGDLYVRTARLREAEDAYQNALPIYQQIEARLGEANTRRALGDLYVRTDRLREAEDAYQNALPIYQQIEDRLGEANTLQGLGNLALKEGAPARAFGHFLQALAIQRSILSLLGEGGSYIYLTRAARASQHLEQAVALGGTAWRLYRRLEDSFDQFLALDDLADCFAALDDEEALRATLGLAFHIGKVLPEPVIEAMLGGMRNRFPGFIPSPETSESRVATAEAILASALDRYEHALVARGEDPLAPLADPSDLPSKS